MVPIHWDRRVMTEWVTEFEQFFAKYRGVKNYVLGFSYGAMIALASAKRVHPDKLFLCSLSPYFNEDLPKIPVRWKKFIGKRRVQDFKKFRVAEITKETKIPTTVFLGEVEAKKFSTLEYRCRETAKHLKASLITIPGAPHDIGNAHYQQALDTHIAPR